MNISFFRTVCLTGCCLFAALAARAEPTLLGNKGLTGQTLDGESVKAVLLGKKVTLGDTRVVIIIAKAAEAQDQFLQQSVGMTATQFQNHWRRLFMTGSGTAPKVVDSDVEGCKLAAETPGAIFIADRAKADGLVVLASAK